MSTFTIRELLHGTKPGRMQSVGIMQVIPLVLTNPDLATDGFATPHSLTVDTRENYGIMGFHNRDGEKPIIVPANTAIMTQKMAQDHAMTKAGLIGQGARRTFLDACCIQETQAGQFGDITGEEIQILPYALRETALKFRGQEGFSKLWPAIRKFNEIAKAQDTRGNLVAFQAKYASVLDQFVAEFEVVPNQIGAIVLVDGKLLGVERAPNHNYWLAVWEPLVRMCYGSQAVIQTVGKTTGTSPSTPSAAKAILDEGITSLDELKAAVDKAIRGAENTARKVVRDLIDDDFKADMDDSMRVSRDGETSEVKVWTLEHDQFIGQAVTDAGDVVYASMTSKAGWKRRRASRKAPAFSL
jgi:hypothetical protein